MHFTSSAIYDPNSMSPWLMDRCKKMPGMLLYCIIVRRPVGDPIDNFRTSCARGANPLNFVQPHHPLRPCAEHTCAEHTKAAAEARAAAKSAKFQADPLPRRSPPFAR